MFDALARVGIDITDAFRALERQGVEKFETSGAELADTVQNQLDCIG